MKAVLKNLALFLCLNVMTLNVAFAQDEAVHDAIRAMRDRAIAAFIARDEAALLAELDERVIFTAMNNETVIGKEAISAYYKRMMDGSSGLIRDVTVDFQTDALATLLADNQAAVASGSVTADFKMRAGLEFTVPLRWTATLTRESGDWKIVALHFSANIFDNPLDSGVRKYLWLMLGAAGLIGLALGVLIGRLRK